MDDFGLIKAKDALQKIQEQKAKNLADEKAYIAERVQRVNTILLSGKGFPYPYSEDTKSFNSSWYTKFLNVIRREYNISNVKNTQIFDERDPADITHHVTFQIDMIKSI